ncbi:hypothetical protein [uncultured Pedobacter sp.]|uniref:hypothetical protein n=1 Tax=uncultured Pedobacter sp. TaxID=246139 RepID=UPI0025DC45DF|nr:hypothetical protein [uncultured Pedobacter sp.]
MLSDLSLEVSFGHDLKSIAPLLLNPGALKVVNQNGSDHPPERTASGADFTKRNGLLISLNQKKKYCS